ncbi:MAG: type I restriction endonuclease subunit R, partial [Phycisphaerae bacterium]
RILIAADKFQTGFDQPLLHTMYVDKRLSGIQAVQTLSRLNRTHPGKEDTFVLDFYNEREEVLKASQDYYETQTVGDEADPQQTYVLQAQLDGAGVYHQEDVDAFCRAFFAPRYKQSPADHAAMNAAVNAAVDRFRTLRDELRPTMSEEAWQQVKAEAQEGFRAKLQGFRTLYSFLSQVIPYQDSDLEKLYTFGRFLLKKLPRPESGPQYDFDDDVTLKYYRLQRLNDGSIDLQPGMAGELKGPTAVGTGRAKEEEVELSQLIDTLNDRFGTDFRPADQLFLDSVREDAVADPELQQAAEANTSDNFGYVFRRALEGLFIDRMEQNEDIFNRFMADADFRNVVEQTLREQVYEQLRSHQ